MLFFGCFGLCVLVCGRAFASSFVCVPVYMHACVDVFEYVFVFVCLRFCVCACGREMRIRQ